MSNNLSWSATATDVVLFGDQDLTVGFSTEPGDPIGTVTIRGTGTAVLKLPNSTQASPTWQDIPGTSPVLQARQDGHFPNTDIMVRFRDGAPARQSGTVPESMTTTINRPTLVTPGTAADVWQFSYNGNRVTYANEYACLRVRGVPDDQIPARFMSHNTRDGTAHPIFQVSLANGSTHVFQVLANGDILSTGGLSLIPTAPQVPVFTAPAVSASLISDGAATGAPYGLSTTLHASDNRVFMDGAVVNGGGAPIAGGTVLFTVVAAHRPTSWVQFSCRTSTTLSARATLKPNGTLILDQPLAAGATCSFDGANWRKG